MRAVDRLMIHSVTRPGTNRIKCLRSEAPIDVVSPDLIKFADRSPSA
jgi:hypothetical protein